MRKIVTILLSLSVYTFGYAQVTIGSDAKPVEGALLDLKQQEEANGNSNSDKGLGLPRVNLQAVDLLEPCAVTNAANEKSHIGLTVYNITENATLVKGIYVWNGAKWQLHLGPWYDVATNIPAEANNRSAYLNAQAVVGGTTVLNNAALSVHGTAQTSGNVGIGTAPQNNASLALAGGNRGLQLPTVTLASANDNTTVPVGLADAGMLVYHLGGNNIEAGIKAWNGTSWVRHLNEVQLPQVNMVEQNGVLTFPTPFQTSVSTAYLQVPLPQIRITEAGNYRVDVRLRGWITASNSNNNNSMSTNFEIRVNGITQDTYFHSTSIVGLAAAGWEITFSSYLANVPQNALITIFASAGTNTAVPANITSYTLRPTLIPSTVPCRVIWQKL